MRTRIISAVVAIGLLAAIVYLGSTAIGIAVFALSVVGVHEFYKALSKGGFNPLFPIGYIACLPLLFLAFTGMMPGSAGNEAAGVYSGRVALIAIASCVFVLVVILFCVLIFSDGKYSVSDIAVTLTGIIYVVFLFSFVTLTRNLGNGNLYIWLIFIGAWVTDTFAYFTGVSVGKTKILPKVSPKKSLEGSIGGVIGCVAGMMLFGFLFKGVLNVQIYHYAILGVICGIVSQIGDWAASAVKRSVNIKDYGNIMPGHGGVLDRLDSILFVAPAVYFYISLFF